MNIQQLQTATINIAKAASEKILAVYDRAEAVKVHVKSDHSPLTEADLLSHQFILAALSELTPDWPVLTEESPSISFVERARWSYYWLVDPLDGTKEFIQRTGEFAINIALIKDHKPVMGIVYVPVQAICYFAAKGLGAFKQHDRAAPQVIQTRPFPSLGIAKVVASRRHGLEQLQTFLKSLGDHAILHSGSALKCCVVAEGTADVYPRFGPTSEWDTAAGQCILEEAGGKLFDISGQPLCYNMKDSLVNPSFLAVGDPHWDWMKYLRNHHEKTY